MGSKNWMIYGATGYTGTLILRKARALGMRPIIGGRTAQALADLTFAENMEARIFSVDSVEEAVRYLQGIEVVLNCAGPFSETAPNLIKACIQTGTHYIDIASESSVLDELLNANRSEFAKSSIAAICGAGSDGTLSECLAIKLKSEIPDATDLRITSASKMQHSRGTLLSLIEEMAADRGVRRNSKLSGLPSTMATSLFSLEGSSIQLAAAVPTPAASSAWKSTQIPNISGYLVLSPQNVRYLRRVRTVSRFLNLPFLSGIWKWFMTHRTQPPTQEQRQAAPTKMYGQARNGSGSRVSMRITAPNAFETTAELALRILNELLMSDRKKAGIFTVAEYFGGEFPLQLPGVELSVIESTKTQTQEALQPEPT